MSGPTSKVIPAPPEIRAAKAWFQAHYDPDKIAASFSARGERLEGLIYIPPTQQATVEILLRLVQALTEGDTPPD